MDFHFFVAGSRLMSFGPPGFGEHVGEDEVAFRPEGAALEEHRFGALRQDPGQLLGVDGLGRSGRGRHDQGGDRDHRGSQREDGAAPFHETAQTFP